MRKLLILFVVLAIASPVWAQPFTGTVNVSMTIAPYTNVIFQTMSMTFGPGDWQNSSLIGAYGSPTIASNAPTATGYFEEAGGAWMWIESNQPLPATTVTTSGHLLGQVSGYQIPTWFTTHVNGWDQVLGAPDARGFANGSPGGFTNWVADGTAPGATSPGGYGGDGALNGGVSVPGGNISYGGEDFYGNQDCFQMDVTPPAAIAGYVYTMPMGQPFGPVGPGTLLFHGRILRSGVLDVADTYTATITVFFN